MPFKLLRKHFLCDIFFSSPLVFFCFFFFRGRKIHEQEAMKTQHTGSFYYRHHDIKIEAKPVDQSPKSMEINKSRAVLPKTNGSRYQNQQQQASKLSSEQQHAVVEKVFMPIILSVLSVFGSMEGLSQANLLVN